MFRKLSLTSLLCCLSAFVYAGDSTHRFTFHVKTLSGICVRAETGWNKSWFMSGGLSYLYQNYSEHGSGYFVPYIAAEVNYANYTTATPFFMGYKAGIEFGGNLMTLVAELRLYSGNRGESLIFTPKIGFSAVGRANLLYGYNVFDKSSNVYLIGRHQISLNFNFTVLKINSEMRTIEY